MCFRYEREINLGHRPVLKRVHEHDDVPAKHMVLIIADIKNMINAEGISPGARDYELVLTDGWYQIKAVTDSRMERAIARGKLVIGSKLAICGAQLGGDSQPRSPLSASSNDTYLSITTNGSRLVPWDTKLGYQKDRLIFRSLSTVFEDGGLVTAMDVIVCRKYPMMYTETLSDGTRIKRTAREEEEIRRQFSGMRMNMQREQSSPGGDLSVLPSKLENRNVSVHFKMQLCDYHCSGNKKIKQKMATLLLLNANELNHMDIQEGSRYRIFFTMPYTFLDKSNSSNNTSHLNTSSTLHLKTTHKTRWENIANVDEEKMASTLYIPRFITMTALMETLEKNSEIDIAALVIRKSFFCLL
ncbi:hypothetical protein BDA99DRAFT_446266 [Phascolomyces articulosus]|uniref:BRCA2 OB1 domain-containing protein n=1 Tax=Phascolomyces articulosus TaxID=60185 RepID=A0AAD5P8L2_9FUNG|nr:hypothetical protein BDA99DRAFT_446266 [Phascolomyces articulosus]